MLNLPRQLSIIILSGMTLRILWAIIIPVEPVSDSIAYDTFARNLLDYGVFGWTADTPHAYWPPGTSLLYAALYWVFGVSYLPIVVFNIVLSCALILTSYRVAERLYSSNVAFYVACLIAFWPTMIMYATLLASELLYLTLTIAALDLWTSTTRSRYFLKMVCAGVLLGAATLVRPLALLLPLIFATCFWFRSGFKQQTLLEQARLATVAFVFLVCIVGPWTLRNYELFGEFIPVSTNGGITLWMGNAPGTDGRLMGLPDYVEDLPNHVQSRILQAEAIEHIKADPLGLITRAIPKFFYLYGNESVGAGWNYGGIEKQFGEITYTVMKRMTQGTWAIIFLCFVAGILVQFRREPIYRAIACPFFVMVAYYTTVHLILVAQERYHMSFGSQIAVYAAIGFIALRSIWFEKINKR